MVTILLVFRSGTPRGASSYGSLHHVRDLASFVCLSAGSRPASYKNATELEKLRLFSALSVLG
jgi:hypothetical protein